MQAQYNVQLSDAQKAEVARLVLEANAAYGESNNPQRRYLERVQARHGCRQLLDQALAMQPGGLYLHEQCSKVLPSSRRMDLSNSSFPPVALPENSNWPMHPPGQ